ncbi:50S ribosomal protein L20 [Candidatus Berkelbacteria bacterium]|nr:50S ribosomal protein L20 [Candidatus Berkelbacteria bacterium]
MARIKGGVTSRRRHKKLFKLTKSYRHGRKHIVKHAKEAVLKSGVYAYRDRRAKKRTARSLWITKINAAARTHGMRYSDLMRGLATAKITLNRKSLAELAEWHPAQFEALMKSLKKN